MWYLTNDLKYQKYLNEKDIYFQKRSNKSQTLNTSISQIKNSKQISKLKHYHEHLLNSKSIKMMKQYNTNLWITNY